MERGSKIEDEARIENAKRSRIEGEARSESENPRKSGRWSGEGLGKPLPRKVLKI